MPAERRAKILAIAAAEFAAHGYHGTSYNRLLGRLALGKSSAYHYFEDKADLLLTAVSERYIPFFDGVSALPRPRNTREFWPFIDQLNVSGFRFMLDDPTSAALMECLRREGWSFDRILAEHRVLGSLDEYHREILSVGQRLGAVRTDASLEHLTYLSKTLASAADLAFVAEVRLKGPTKVSRRLRAIAAEWTEAYRRLLEPQKRTTRVRVQGRSSPKTTVRGAR